MFQGWWIWLSFVFGTVVLGLGLAWGLQRSGQARKERTAREKAQREKATEERFRNAGPKDDSADTGLDPKQ